MVKIFAWLKGLFKHQPEGEFDKEARLLEMEDKEVGTSRFIASQLISFSNASYTCAEAARVCIGKHADEDYEKRLAHIKRVVGRGHESTIAQSNIVMMISYDNTYLSDFAQCSDAFKFLNISDRIHDGRNYLLIGGSIRAYKYFIRHVRDLANPFCIKIMNSLYGAAEREFFEDFINDGIMMADKFGFAPLSGIKGQYEHKFDEDGDAYDEEVAVDTGVYMQPQTKGKYVDIIHSDNPYVVFDFVKGFGFDMTDVLRVTACTIFFHDFSRSTSQQITRHFAGISQESQRYVDYSKSQFISPLPFGDYDLKKHYLVKLFDKEVSKTGEELGDELAMVYGQLVKQGMLKQDARAYLPFNVATKVLMTFTFADLIHFIKERDNKAAQPEVQVMTRELEQLLAQHNETSALFSMNSMKSLIEDEERPRYKDMEKDLQKLDSEIDEVVSVNEEVEYVNK